jgi:competence protein ComEC
MNQPPFTHKQFFIALSVSLAVLLILFFFSFFDNRTKIVFCDVGQGDAAYIRLKNKFDILVDAGPNNSVLQCLGKHMPFYDRKIEIAILSHPNIDHYAGYLYLFDRYQVDNFFTSSTEGTSTYRELLGKIKQKKTRITLPQKGTIIKIAEDQLKFYSNSQNELVNEGSLVFTLEENKFRVLFTGDISGDLLPLIGEIDILKVPHHGSKTSLNYKWLKLAEPRVSVISAGKNNRYGHPAKELLDAFKKLNLKYLRTDEKGDIEFKITP